MNPYRLVHRAIPEDSTRVAELITGGVEMAVNIPPMKWDRADSEPGMSINRANSQRVMLETGRWWLASGPSGFLRLIGGTALLAWALRELGLGTIRWWHLTAAAGIWCSCSPLRYPC